MLLILILFLKQAEASPLYREWYSEEHAAASREDGDFDMDLVLFGLSVLFMVFFYAILTLVYLVLRLLIRRYFIHGITLSNSSESSIRSAGIEARWQCLVDNEEDIKDRLAQLSPEEQFYYRQGEEFIKQNPPFILPYQTVAGGGGYNSHNTTDISDPIINDQTLQYIEEEGVNAWEFQPSSNLPNDFVLVKNRSELTFLNCNADVSVMTNLPIPLVNKVYYFECKIFEIHGNTNNLDHAQHLSDNEIISFGLATSPYPYFRLPGRHHHSIAYDSTGARRLNDSFNLAADLASVFPRCEKGDVIGVGYRTRSGTVFFTRNGKKLNEKHIGGHIKGWKFKYVYPIVGANTPCKIHVNFGTYGFVYIEANVKKWGYAKSNGLKLPPPSYEEYDQDMLLESSYEDEASDGESAVTLGGAIYAHGALLPPPPGFEFSTTPNSNGDQFTMGSLPVEPPGYSSDRNEDGHNDDNFDDEVGESAALLTSQRMAAIQRSPEDLHVNTFANQFLEGTSIK
ncbi:Ear1p Ecym_3376 [Eremothecium cymbalariae DBVPG|uniref:B30.2/SPRY domain-containing protein n=1 Tax=Eremothecium cymbalariae (strain CBS 270.75 / DBVPG 7215 / KCTC 17166 / NRRL Y-17582) TaxID=931890 RepID=G8JRU4_ERECY|nr:Hypothetical protein Ecym_3376 [Eremothecium cymbalariae DBVPG\